MCAVLNSVCVTTVDNSGVYPYVLDALLDWVSLEHAFTYVSTTNQTERRSSATHLLARWEHEGTTARWSHAQVGGPSVILQPAYITSSGAF